MVIKKRAKVLTDLTKRIEVLEYRKSELARIVEKLNEELKEIAITVENGFEDGKKALTPGRLLREYLLGEEKETE